MNILVFDTETTSLEKPFCYNIGYTIVDTSTKETLIEREFVIEQVWNNKPLFCSAYYASKREIYVSRMRGKTIQLRKYGYVMQQMIRDIANFEVVGAYAFNSNFDDGVFQFNCDWFKTQNPFDNVPIFDIRGYVHEFIAETKEFQDFCEENEQFTATGNYSTTAETLFRFISKEYEFNEEHTALADSRIEKDILLACLDLGANLNYNYKAKRSIERKVERELNIVHNDTKTTYAYNKKIVRGNTIYLH